MKKFRIAILGAGGVGGFIAGMLSNSAKAHDGLEIIVIARGRNKEVIRQNGIKIITPQEEITGMPTMVSDDPSQIGELDLLVIATKSYDLEQAVQPVLTAITPRTFVLPLVNGVSATATIRRLTDKGILLEGFMYIVSSLVEPGVVKVAGKGHSLYLGISPSEIESPSSPNGIIFIRDLFISAGINAIIPADIIKAEWEKFFFISTMATLSTYLDKTIHEVADSSDYSQTWIELLHELKAVATAKNIDFDPDIIKITLAKVAPIPHDATTSMHRDWRNKKQTEVETLTGYVVREASTLNVDVPLYNKMYVELMQKQPDGQNPGSLN